MKINKVYENSIGGNQKEFIEFVKDRTNIENYSIEELMDEKDIDWFIHRIAQNLFYYEDNLNEGKRDFIQLVAMLMKKGFIFKNIK